MIKPMLAKEYCESKLDFSKRVFVQPKLDGIRCIANKDGLWTRNQKRITSLVYLEESLSELFKHNNDLILDGEIYCHDLKDNFNKITSIVRQKKPTLDRSLSIYFYDVASMNTSYSDRLSFLNSLKIKVLETVEVTSKQEIDDLYYHWTQQGYEGQIIRLDSYYENKRSNNLLKRKEFISEELRVVRIEEGKGKWSGYIKRFVLVRNEKEFAANVKGTREQLCNLRKPDWATVRYFNLTPSGQPRFPVVIDWGWGCRED